MGGGGGTGATHPATVDWDKYPWPEAITWFARGYGAVRRGKDAEARNALGPLQELEGRAAKSGEEIFARQIQILRLDLAAWAAHAMHDDDSAITTLQQAVELENSTPKPPVTPAPTIPAAELLADMLAELKRPREAWPHTRYRCSASRNDSTARRRHAPVRGYGRRSGCREDVLPTAAAGADGRRGGRRSAAIRRQQEARAPARP
jgi:hypothetical protein